MWDDFKIGLQTILPKWISPWWWKFLLSDCRGWKHFWCRVRNHPNGVVWFNAGGTEPNMKCVDCGEDLG